MYMYVYVDLNPLLVDVGQALRVSMEEQRQRQEEEVRRTTHGSTDKPTTADTAPTGIPSRTCTCMMS